MSHPAKPSTSNPARGSAALLFIGCFCIYSLTLTRNYLGYEGETICQARAAFHSDQKLEGRAGLLDVAFYLPFVGADEFLRARNLFPSYQGLVPNFALPFFMAITVVLVFLAAAEVFHRGVAAVVALIFAFGTMAWPYSKMGMELSLTFCTALALWGFTRELRRAGQGGYLLMAAGLGAMLLTKVQAPLVVMLFFIFIGCRIMKGELRGPSRLVLGGMLLIGLVSVGIFLWGNQYRYGRPFLSTSYSASWETAPPSPSGYLMHLAGYFISPGKSVFLFNPPLLLLFVALVPFCKSRRWYIDLLFIFVLPQILFHAYFRTWADETWGPRRLVSLLPALVFPIGALLEKRKWKVVAVRRIVSAAVIAGVLMQMLAVSMNYASYIYLLKPFGLGTQKNIAWSLRLSQIPFQTKLLASYVSRLGGGESLSVRASTRDASFDPDDSLPWNAPEIEAAILVQPTGTGVIALSLARYDEHPDFWWVIKPVRDPNWKWWRDRSMYLTILLAVAGFLSLGVLLNRLKSPQSPSLIEGNDG